MKSKILPLNSYGEGLPQLREFLTASAGDNRGKLASVKKALKSAILNELTGGQREVLSLYYYENMKISEIAKALGVNKSSVSRRLKRAHGKLKRVLTYGYYPELGEEDYVN